MCHKGVTISVAPEAVDAHLLHGDTMGPCPEGLEPVVTEEPAVEIEPSVDAAKKTAKKTTAKS